MEEKALYWHHNLIRVSIYTLLVLGLTGIFINAFKWFWVVIMALFYLLYLSLRPNIQKFLTEDWCFVMPIIILLVYLLVDKSIYQEYEILEFLVISIPVYTLIVAKRKKIDFENIRTKLHG